ncbi:hypothetical protein [Sphingosinithalassobacter sp. CS137]|uniref:hypothetical protein n=1 Tax=Sphingosinithalassobacter sp. CS137 TaxID=2762748 RepID=UPI00165E6176|nr:hypothetical protein [Sphingosinithalassobacter sp. CS137]
MRPVIAPMLLLAVAAASTPQDAGAIRSGPLVGMWSGPVIASNGDQRLVSLLPSAAGASPPAPATAAAVDRLIAAEEEGALGDAAAVVRTGATMTFCPAEDVSDCRSGVPFAGFDIPGEVRANTPYALPNDVVRVEWIADGRVTYISFLQFADGKLAGVRTGPAVMPVRATQAQTSEPN